MMILRKILISTVGMISESSNFECSNFILKFPTGTNFFNFRLTVSDIREMFIRILKKQYSKY